MVIDLEVRSSAEKISTAWRTTPAMLQKAQQIENLTRSCKQEHRDYFLKGISFLVFASYCTSENRLVYDDI